MAFDPYGPDVLAADPHAPQITTSRPVVAEVGLVVEDVDTGWVGAIVGVAKAGGMHVVDLEDRRGRVRSFRLGPGFWIDGAPVHLTAPPAPGAPSRESGRLRTASGSTAVPGARARVARESRIWVEGRHDAELVATVWGADLALDGVVVEMLDGVDHLPDRVAAFGPSPGRRLGVLVDHLVPGSKESRLAADVREQVRRTMPSPTSRDPLAASRPSARVTTGAAPAGGLDVDLPILILGHPYVDVWQAIRPQRLGLDAWPTIPHGRDIKVDTLAALGMPHSSQEDIADGWRRILATVRDWRDLDPALLARVEELIDFVTG
ncbi:MAG: DUF3097 domain-containing protein [Bifidobacteriaceae bacterium]|nr:DUF3097 domain-containing protein [Bifidobacteriaceae bacterium]